MLEAIQWPQNCFATLTYEDEQLVCSDGLKIFTSDGGMRNALPSLQPRDLQLFMKVIRKAFEPERMRFYGVGEYGGETWRPHYHVALFNFPTCSRGRTRRRPGSDRPIWRGCCAACELVGTSWGKGDVDLGVLEVSSAQYVAGYVTKKMTLKSDARLEGRHPEFARMSRRPGVGLGFVHDIASELLRFDLENTQGDVPVTLRHGKRQLPLGRYLRRKLRLAIGKEETTPEDVLKKQAEELLPLRLAARSSADAPSLAAQIEKVMKGKAASWEARQRIHKGRKLL